MKIKAMAFAALFVASPALAGDITIDNAYARAASPAAKSGAAFMEIVNGGPEDDRLLSVSSDVAAKLGLHTSTQSGDGIMRMQALDEGIAIPAGGMHRLARGGDHVMLMGLKTPLLQGAKVTLTLTFEKAGEMTVEIPVDLDRGEEAQGTGTPGE